MNLEQLKRRVDFTAEHLPQYQQLQDVDVLITLTDNSVGARASTQVSSAGLGFDFEFGQFRLQPQDQLIKLNNSLFTARDVITNQSEFRNFYTCPRCGLVVSRQDHFCKHCAQKLK